MDWVGHEEAYWGAGNVLYLAFPSPILDKIIWLPCVANPIGVCFLKRIASSVNIALKS